MTGQDCLNRYSTVSYLRFGHIILWIGKVYIVNISPFIFSRLPENIFFQDIAAVPVSFGFSQMRPAPASFLWRRCGDLRCHWKNGDVSYCSEGHNSAVFSGLSDEHRSKDACGLTSAEEFWPRWQNYGISEQLGTPCFETGTANIPTAPPKERKTPGAFGKGQRSTGTVADYPPLSLTIFSFEAFRNLFSRRDM